MMRNQALADFSSESVNACFAKAIASSPCCFSKMDAANAIISSLGGSLMSM
jgi:hypothetical protein